MTLWEAALWGLAGGVAAGLLSISTAVVAAGFAWPWGDDKRIMVPRLFVFAIEVALGGFVAAAAHDQISGPWPAFIFGIGAPATIRGLLSNVEVTPKASSTEQPIAAEGQPLLPQEEGSP